MKRVIFYFDGFNFYNGLKEKSAKDTNWKDYYWIDFVKFCSSFVYADSELKSVKYFTAPPHNENKKSKQSALFSANKLLNPDRFQVINGQYLHKKVSCLAKCKEEFKTLEEKRTDVNIAITMLLDCMNDEVDTLVLITADSDQIPTIDAIKRQFPKKSLKVYFPPERSSADILSRCKPIVYLEKHEDKFVKAKMPGEVKTEGNAKKYTRPVGWTKDEFSRLMSINQFRKKL